MPRGSHTLTRITNQAYLVRYFRTNARRFGFPLGQLERLTITEIGRERFKRALKYTLGFRSNPHRAFERTIRGNVPSRHHLRELVVADRTLRLLRRSGFADGPVQAPRPLGYNRALRLFLYESSPGRSLSTVLLNVSKRRQARLIREAATGLARLHALRLRGPLAWTDRRVTLNLKYFRDDFARLGQPWVRRAEPILDNVREAVRASLTARQPGFCLVHGDFTPYNVLVRRGGITIIDFGNALNADPLLDVASFISQLELIGARKKLAPRRTAALMHSFERTYWKATKRSRSLRRTYTAYRAWWLLQAAAYLASTRPIKTNAALIRFIFRRARQLLVPPAS